MIQLFRTDPAYLNKYYAKVSAVLLVACGALFALRPPGATSYLWYLPAIVVALVPRFSVILVAYAYAVAVSLTVMRAAYHPAYLLLVPLALYLALIATAYIHGAAHDSLRPRWLRRPVGELCGLFHLVGFPDWTIVHFVHHRHADDPEWDPHPPKGLTYWQFLNGVKTSIFRVLANRYFGAFGEDSPAAQRAWKTLPLFAMITQLLKMHFWFLLLGGQAFTFLFLTSIVFKNLHYAFFNYVTHVPSAEDPEQMVIVNLDRGVFFTIVNALSHGLYFHKNHHETPGLLDPRKPASAALVRSADAA
jgi:stearoyl-CoA desaturase (delta-9 desaturase)